MKADLKSELKKVVKHAPVYTLGTVLSQLAGFLLIPVYTRFLTPTDYGVLQLVVLTGDVISIVVGLKASETILRFYYETEDAGQRKIVISTSLILVGVIGILILLPSILAGNFLAKIILDDSSQGYLMRISFVTIFFNLFVSITYGYIQIKEKSTLFILLSLTRLILNISLNIYFVTIIKIGVFGIVLGTFITSLIYAIITIPYLIRRVGIQYSWQWTKKMLRYSLPYIPSTLANRAAHSSDRYFLRYYLSLSDVGIYSLGYRLGSVVHNIFNVSLFRILNVRIFAVHKAKNAPEIIARMATYTTIFLLFAGLGLSLFSKDIVMIMTPEAYWDAFEIIPAVVLCYVIFSAESFALQPILFLQKTERISLVNLAGGALNVGLNFLLIPAFGVYGAVISTFIAFSFKLTGIYFLGKKLFPIPFEWKRLGNSFLIAIALFFLGWTVSDLDIYLRLICNTFLWLSFLPLLWFAGILNHEEKLQVERIFKVRLLPFLKRA